MKSQFFSKDFIYIYLILLNSLSFLCFLIDKRRAIKKEYRIPESFLLMISFLGGSLGSILGMRSFKHKTKKWKFKIGLPLLLIFNIVTFLYLLGFIAI